MKSALGLTFISRADDDDGFFVRPLVGNCAAQNTAEMPRAHVCLFHCYSF